MDNARVFEGVELLYIDAETGQGVFRIVEKDMDDERIQKFLKEYEESVPEEIRAEMREKAGELVEELRTFARNYKPEEDHGESCNES